MAIAVILLWFVVGNLCSASELPATAYIDVTDVDESSISSLGILAELIEAYFDENDPREILLMLWTAESQSRNLSEGKDLNTDSYKLADKLTEKGLSEFHSAVAEITYLICNPNNYAKVKLDIFLGMIKHFFRENLDEFANIKPTQHPKLHAFLLHFGKEIMSSRIERALHATIRDTGFRAGLKKMINYGLDLSELSTDIISEARNLHLENGDSNALSKAYTDITSEAKNLDLAEGNFNVKSMLKSIEKYLGRKRGSFAKRLTRWLSTTCDQLSYFHRRDMEIYPWSRLLIPDKLAELKAPSEDFLELIELWRVCLPVLNEETNVEVKKNIKRILATPLPSN